MSTSFAKVLREFQNDIDPRQHDYDRHEQFARKVDPEDILLVLCDTLREARDPELMDLIQEEIDHPYDGPEPRIHPDTGKRLARCLICYIQKIKYELAQIHMYAAEDGR